MNSPVLSLQLDRLRGDFDQSFRSAAGLPVADLLSLVAIRLGGEPLVLRTDQISGIARRRRVVPVPSRLPQLLGITSLRGALLPVFSLAALLELPRRDEAGSWLAFAHREAPLAFAFDDFEGQIEVQPGCLYEAGGAVRRHLRQLAQIGSAVRGVVDMASIVEAIRSAAALSRSSQ